MGCTQKAFAVATSMALLVVTSMASAPEAVHTYASVYDVNASRFEARILVPATRPPGRILWGWIMADDSSGANTRIGWVWDPREYPDPVVFADSSASLSTVGSVTYGPAIRPGGSVLAQISGYGSNYVDEWWTDGFAIPIGDGHFQRLAAYTIQYPPAWRTAAQSVGPAEEVCFKKLFYFTLPGGGPYGNGWVPLNTRCEG